MRKYGNANCHASISTPLCHYCEIDLLLQATRSPRVWRWPEGRMSVQYLRTNKVFRWFSVTPQLCTVSSSVYSGYFLSTYSCGIRILSANEYRVRPFRLVLQARLSRGERVWSNSCHHLVSNMPRISWCVNWVSDKWRHAVPFFGMLFRERGVITEDLPLQNTSQLCSHLIH